MPVPEPLPQMNECGLLPLLSPDCKVLILGSYPSLMSLETGEYYANPRNMFWDIIGHILQIPKNRSYQDRVSALMKSKVGLWDVYASCIRPSSADSTIRGPHPNDIKSLVEAHSGIGVIFLNGRESEKGFRLFFPDIHIRAEYLPSSSPAHAISLKDKTDAWSAVTRALHEKDK